MRQSTIITLGASVSFGILAVVLARGWINDAIKDEYSKRAPAIAQSISQPAELDLVSVVVLDADVNFGDMLSTELLKVVEYPADAVPLGTYENFNNIFVDSSQSTIVLRRMARHEPLLDYKISGPGARGSLSALINEGMRAVSVRTNEVNGVAGFIMPGDYVDVIYTRDETNNRNSSNLESDVLLQNVKVLGIDQDLNDESASPNVVSTVTLEVANVDAQKLHLAHDAGKLSLTLRKAGDQVIEQTRTVAQKSILQAPQKRVIIRPKRRSAAYSKSKNSNRTSVTIIRGEEKAQVQVLKDPDGLEEATKLAGGAL